MELELLIKKGVDYTKRNRKLVYALGALGVTSYGAYRIYHLPAVAKKRQRLLKLLSVFVTVIEMISDSAEAIGVISKDLKEFLQSDSDQIPRSLKQISKITTSDEFSDSVTKITRALTLGICRGYRHEKLKNGMTNVSENSRFSDRVLDKLFSEAGSGFASVVAGSFAKNLVMAYYSEFHSVGRANFNGSSNVISSKSKTAPSWVDVLCQEKCRALIGVCVQSFVSTAVAVYLDKTMHINTYDEFFSGLTNPKHETQVRDMLVAICNGAVETLVRTSHHVLTSSDTSADPKLNSNHLPIDFGGNSRIGGHLMSNKLKAIQELDKNRVGDWLSKMSSAMAVSSNRRFVLDVTRRVTFQTVRSFVKFLVEKIADCLRTIVNFIHEDVIEKGVEAFKYVIGKSSAIVTVCFSLFLQTMNGPWFLAPI